MAAGDSESVLLLVFIVPSMLLAYYLASRPRPLWPAVFLVVASASLGYFVLRHEGEIDWVSSFAYSALMGAVGTAVIANLVDYTRDIGKAARRYRHASGSQQYVARSALNRRIMFPPLKYWLLPIVMTIVGILVLSLISGN